MFWRPMSSLISDAKEWKRVEESTCVFVALSVMLYFTS